MKAVIIDAPEHENDSERRDKIKKICESKTKYKLDKDVWEKIRDKYKLYFLHIGNSEFKRRDEDDKKILFLTKVSIYICKNKGRIIFFSGGEKTNNLKLTIKALIKEEYKEGHHFIFLNPSQIDENYKFKNKTIPEDWKVSEIKIGGTNKNITKEIEKNLLLKLVPVEITLRIALIKIDHKGWAENLINLKKIFSETIVEILNVDILCSRISKEELLKHFSRNFAENLEHLYEIIEKNDITHFSEKKIINKIKKAHSEIYNLLTGKTTYLFEELMEKERSILSHNLLKNNFLNIIGSAYSRMPYYIRSDQILKTWDSTADPKKVFKTDVVEVVQSALKNWPEIYKALNAYLNDTPEIFGFKETKTFIDARNKILGDKTGNDRDCYANTINKFVENFDSLANKNRNEQKKNLKKFWFAADQIHELLSKMHFSKKDPSRFYEYFEKRYPTEL